MDTKFGFTLLTPQEFATWINQQSTSRRITHIQEHHTYRPSYANFKANNHFQLQQNMKRFHVHDRGWSDIGQHFSIFPDGKICTGRPLRDSPACIAGHNSGGICIENIGHFDKNADQMTTEQKEAIIQVTALLLNRYSLPCNDQTVVYHHWFTPSGKRTANGSPSQKSCPGTAFFGGNKVTDSQTHFLPLVKTALDKIQSGVIPPGDPSKAIHLGVVTASVLNVRQNPTTNSSKITQLQLDQEVRIIDEKDGWLSIEPKGWVSSRYIQLFTRGEVTASTLNVRASPSTKAPKLYQFQRGEIIRIYEKRSDWSRVGISDGWVASRYIKLL